MLRPQEPGLRSLSSERGETVKSAVLPHVSTRGQQRPGTGASSCTAYILALFTFISTVCSP